MGRDPCYSPAPDFRSDPGAVLYETQKVATVEVMRQSLLETSIDWSTP
jgi:hypothetical protein